MDERTLDWFDLLAQLLLILAAIVLLLGVLAATSIGATEEVPLFEDLQRQSRTVAILGSLGGGIVAAGVLAGLGAIIRLLVAERRDALSKR